MSTGLQCHALVIGINAYTDGIAPLQSAVLDAQVLAETLQTQHGYAVTCLVDEQASGSAIEQFLSETLPSRLSEESAFLLYFAGHGVAQGDGTEGPQGYLLPHDVKRAEADTWLSMDTLRRALDSLPCRHLLVVLDCCFAGAFRWASTRDAVLLGQPLYDSQFRRYLEGDAWQALTSAASDQRAADVTPGCRNQRDAGAGSGHSPFAEALIRGLGGAADSARGGHEPDGVITATELYQFLFEELMPQDGDSNQTPGIWPLRPTNRGEYVFFNPQATLNTVPDPPLDDSNNPWRGLKAYSSGDAGLFFGRQRVVDALLDRLLDETAPALLVVVGASGTGKSSVVKAGLLPLLASPPQALRDRLGAWAVVQSPRLGVDPSQQLAGAVASLASMDTVQSKLLLIDQFEELYTQCPSEEARGLFLKQLRSLIDAGQGLKVVITLRSDFEPRLASSEALQDLLPSARFLVPAFSVEETREIIEGPAAVKALYFDPAELVDQLIEEVAAMPGALPLLSFALAEMYRHAQLRRRESGASDRALTQDDYAATGGVVGAVHKRATLLFEQSDAASQQTIRRVFLRLLSQDGARLARRRVHLSELRFADKQEQKRVDSVVKSYVDARLLMIDGEFIEPAHDTLIVAWELLQNWLTESGSQQLNRALWGDASDWDAHQRESGFLWDGDPRLPQANTAFDELNLLEQEFISTSSRRKKSRRRLLFGITASVIVALSFATLYSLERASEAARQTGIAELQLAEARYANGKFLLELARQQSMTSDYFSAAMTAGEALGFQGFGTEKLRQVETAFPVMLGADKPEYTDLIEVLGNAVMESYRPLAWRGLDLARFSRNGDLLAGVTAHNTVEVWHLNSGHKSELELPQDENVSALTVSDDGSMLAAVTRSGNHVLFWRLADGAGQPDPDILNVPLTSARVEFAAERERFNSQIEGNLELGDIFTAVFSPDGRQLAAAGTTGVVLWNLDPESTSLPSAPIALDIESKSGLNSLAFFPDGKSLALGSWHNRIRQVYIDSTRAETTPEVSAFIEATDVASRPIGPSWGWDRWSENVQKGDHVTALAVTPEEKFLVVVSANQVLIGEATDDGYKFDKAGSVYETRTRIESLALTNDGRFAAIVSEDGAIILAVPSLLKVAALQPFTLEYADNWTLSFNADATLLAWSGGGQMELRDTSMLNHGGFEISEEQFVQESPEPYTEFQKLREFIESGEFDMAHAAAALNAPMHSSDFDLSVSATYLTASFLDESDFQHTMRLSPQPPEGALIAAGIDRFSGGHDFSRINVYQMSTGQPVMQIVLPEGMWGMDQLFFNASGTELLAGFSNFDGFFASAYRWPMLFPDLTVYATPGSCHGPVNLPAGSTLTAPGLLVCESN